MIYNRGLKHAARGPHMARQMCQSGPRSSLKMIEYDFFNKDQTYFLNNLRPFLFLKSNLWRKGETPDLQWRI